MYLCKKESVCIYFPLFLELLRGFLKSEYPFFIGVDISEMDLLNLLLFQVFVFGSVHTT